MHSVRDWLALRRSLLKGPDHGALLLDRKGRRMREFHATTLFDRLNQSRGLGARRLYPHLMRHSVATHMLQNGADIRHIQAFLGHSSLESTKIYLRLVPGRFKEDHEKASPEISVKG